LFELFSKRQPQEIAVYRSCIVCIRLSESVALGDILVAKTPEARFRWGAIEKMEIAGSPVTTAGIGAEVGMQVGFHAKENQTFYVLPGVPAYDAVTPPVEDAQSDGETPSLPPA